MCLAYPKLEKTCDFFLLCLFSEHSLSLTKALRPDSLPPQLLEDLGLDVLCDSASMLVYLGLDMHTCQLVRTKNMERLQHQLCLAPSCEVHTLARSL